MIISIWRYSHLALAVSSFLFTLIASITGVVLAFEPISEQVKPYGFDLDKHDLAKTIAVLQNEYEEVISIERDHNDFIIASVITNDGSDAQFYIDPATGKKVGDLIEKAPIFQWMTNLHRSLFLKSTGRAIIGIVSFLLFLIAVTGVILIAKRQGGVRKLLTRVVKEDTEQYYHVVLGRYSLIPIVILTLTGVYLSLEKFSLLPEEQFNHNYDFPENSSQVKLHPKDFTLFKDISLKEIKKVEFPFSDDPEDYFLVDLKSKELLVHQYNGTVLSEVQHPFVAVLSTVSLNLHTGRGSILWSIILLSATSSIFYFVYSGFAMTLKRRKKNVFVPKNIHSPKEAEYVILVGSETGSTYKPAKLIFDSIKAFGKKVFITEMNNYAEFPKMKELLVFTSTYGTGKAPSNASNFLEKFTTNSINNAANYSVVGFGSLAYPDFCEFAIDVDLALQHQENFQASTPLYKIHNQSFADFKKWSKEWSEHVGISLNIKEDQVETKLPKQQDFKVVERTDLNIDDTFTLQLRPNKKVKFQSGDLLAFYPEEDSVARYYSIGSKGNDVLLSIKKHEQGIVSSFFSKLVPGDSIKAAIQTNTHFHFPKKSEEVILIANGTGIAPFLGMLQEHHPHKNVHLFWGGRTKTSFELYQKTIEKAMLSGQLSQLHIAYSRENQQKEYVQDIVAQQSNLIAEVLQKKGTIMICGSLAMEKGVLQVLENIAVEQLQTDFSTFSQQIKSDCY